MDNSCIFCDRTKISDRIIAENSDWYVVATLGQIIGGYALVIPKAHISCIRPNGRLLIDFSAIEPLEPLK